MSHKVNFDHLELFLPECFWTVVPFQLQADQLGSYIHLSGHYSYLRAEVLEFISNHFLHYRWLTILIPNLIDQIVRDIFDSAWKKKIQGMTVYQMTRTY